MVKGHVNYEDMITVALSKEECRTIISIFSAFSYLYSRVGRTLVLKRKIEYNRNMTHLEPLLKKFSFDELSNCDEDKDIYEQKRFDTDVCL